MDSFPDVLLLYLRHSNPPNEIKHSSGGSFLQAKQDEIIRLIKHNAIRPAYKKYTTDTITHWFLNWSSSMVKRVLRIEPMRLGAEGSKTVAKTKYGYSHIAHRCAAFGPDNAGESRSTIRPQRPPPQTVAVFLWPLSMHHFPLR